MRHGVNFQNQMMQDLKPLPITQTGSQDQKPMTTNYLYDRLIAAYDLIDNQFYQWIPNHQPLTLTQTGCQDQKP